MAQLYLRGMKLLVFFAAALLVVACFLPWVIIESQHLEITGVNTAGTTFGKPAYLHFILAGLSLLSLIISSSWGQKVAVVFCAFNLAWSIRNFTIVSNCQMGECPIKHIGIYLLIPASVLLLISTFLWRKRTIVNG